MSLTTRRIQCFGKPLPLASTGNQAELSNRRVKIGPASPGWAYSSIYRFNSLVDAGLVAGASVGSGILMGGAGMLMGLNVWPMFIGLTAALSLGYAILRRGPALNVGAQTYTCFGLTQELMASNTDKILLCQGILPNTKEGQIMTRLYKNFSLGEATSRSVKYGLVCSLLVSLPVSKTEKLIAAVTSEAAAKIFVSSETRLFFLFSGLLAARFFSGQLLKHLDLRLAPVIEAKATLGAGRKGALKLENGLEMKLSKRKLNKPDGTEVTAFYSIGTESGRAHLLGVEGDW